MRELVWVTGWQLECCGEAFSPGDLVRWTLSADPDLGWLTTVLGPDLARTVTRWEDHHGGLPEGTQPTRGRVTRVRAVEREYVPPAGDSRVLQPVPGSARVTDVDRADGADSGIADHRLSGYLVDLDVVGS